MRIRFSSIKAVARNATYRALGNEPPPNLEKYQRIAPEISADEVAVLEKFGLFTMTGPVRQYALVQAIRYLNGRPIAGDIVECGVWRGGNMLIAKALCEKSPVGRKFYLYDTFTGMSEPTELDVAHDGTPAAQWNQKFKKETHNVWCHASLDDVRENFRASGLLNGDVFFVKGKVEDTLRDPNNLPEKIALLRLDTDFYESTKAELEILYPRLVPGGVLIIDDYGYWAGARKATNEYFAGSSPLLIRLDHTARMLVKC